MCDRLIGGLYSSLFTQSVYFMILFSPAVHISAAASLAIWLISSLVWYELTQRWRSAGLFKHIAERSTQCYVLVVSFSLTVLHYPAGLVGLIITSMLMLASWSGSIVLFRQGYQQQRDSCIPCSGAGGEAETFWMIMPGLKSANIALLVFTSFFSES